MKKLLFLIAFAALNPFANQPAHSSPATGTEVLENADMADGTLRWRGDVKAAGSDSSTDFVTKQQDAKGIMVDLRSSTWTTVKQEIRNQTVKQVVHFPHRAAANNPMLLSIEYHVSSDFSLSTKASDYTGDETKSGIGGLLGFNLSQIYGKPGQILTFLDAAPASRGSDANGLLTVYLDNISTQTFTPSAGDSRTYTITISMPPLNGQDNPVFCVAIPPGHGSITFTKISLRKMSP